jgi:hypothetical protein
MNEDEELRDLTEAALELPSLLTALVICLESLRYLGRVHLRREEKSSPPPGQLRPPRLGG